MTPAPKLFIATPAHDHRLSAAYVFSLLALQRSGLFRLFLSKVGGAGVARARNNQAHQFLTQTDCTHFFCIDSDITFTAEQVARIVGHDRDIVCGLYALKQHATAWCTNALSGESPEPATGLQRVATAGTGFMCIKRSVLERMIAARPEIAYVEDLEEAKGVVRWDFFRMGVQGPDTPEEKLAEIRRLRDRFSEADRDHVSIAAFAELGAILDRTAKPGRYLTEDWFLCHVARELGIDIWVDTTFHLLHEGIINFPLRDPFANDVESAPAAAAL